EGFNMRERTLGAFRLDGSPKPVIGALTALDAYLAARGAAPGEFQREDDADGGLRYVYRADDALLLGGKKVDAGSARFEASGPAELFASWSEPGSVRLWASSRMKVTLDLPMLKTTLDLEPGTRTLPTPSSQRGADYDFVG